MRIIYISLLFIIIGCGTDSDIDDLSDLEGSWNKINVDEERIELTDSSGGTLLYSSGHKLFQLSFGASNKYNTELLFRAEKASIADFVNNQDDYLMLGLRYDDLQSEKPVFFESLDNGKNWQAIDSNFPDGMNAFIIRNFVRVGENEEHLVAYAGKILESRDGGLNWNTIFNDGNFSTFLHSDEIHPDQIWTGGYTEIQSPYLAKSTSYGKNWNILNKNIDFLTDSDVRDIILHHQHSDSVLAGLSGPVTSSDVIRRSTDGGISWNTVLEQVGIHTFLRSNKNQNLIYGSGRDVSGKLFFVWTTDFGETWEKEIFEEGPDGLNTNDMALMNIDGNEVLFFGTNRGLFTFTVE